MSMFTLVISCWTTSNLPRLMDLTVYVILFFTTSDFTFTRNIHNWVLFPLRLNLFISSGAISLLFSVSIFNTYWPGEFIFWCHIFLPFYPVRGVLKARMRKRFAIFFSSRPCFVRTLQYDSSVLGGKMSVFFPISKKGYAKECLNHCTIALTSHASKVMLRILQARLQQYVNWELPYIQGGFLKGRGTKDHVANSCGS